MNFTWLWKKLYNTLKIWHNLNTEVLTNFEIINWFILGWMSVQFTIFHQHKICWLSSHPWVAMALTNTLNCHVQVTLLHYLFQIGFPLASFLLKLVTPSHQLREFASNCTIDKVNLILSQHNHCIDNIDNSFTLYIWWQSGFQVHLSSIIYYSILSILLSCFVLNRKPVEQ